MKRKLLFGFVVLLFTVSCSKDDEPPKQIILENQIFVHLFFDSEEECIAAQPEPDFWINCHQELDFIEDNKVIVMLTDILWNGTYSIEKDLLILNLEPNYEIPSGEIKFKILNSLNLVRIEDNTLWKKVSGDSIWN